jgi:PAS domain S-box-containing protein
MVDSNIDGARHRWFPDLPIFAILAGAILAASAIALALTIGQARDQRRIAAGWERHTYDVIVNSHELLIALEDAESGKRGFLLTGMPETLQPFESGMAAAPGKLADLKQLTMDNAATKADLQQLSALVSRRLENLRAAVTLAKAGNRNAAIELVRAGQSVPLMNQTRQILSAINARETRLLRQRIARNDGLLRQVDWMIAGLLVLMAAMIAFGLFAIIAATRAKGKAALAEAESQSAFRLRDADAAAVRAAAVVSALGEAVPDLIYAKDREGRITYANPSTLAVTGKTLAELLGKLTAEFGSDSDEAVKIDENDTRVMDGGKSEVVDEVFTGPTGQTQLFRSTKSPLFDADGKVIGLAGISVDVTAERSAMAQLKASEERFRSLSETVPAFIFITDDNGEITYTNSAFQEYTGKTGDELLGMGWIRTVHRDDRGIPEQAWSAAVGYQKHYAAEYRFKRHDGNFRTFMCRATPARDADGNIRQWVGTCSDVQDAINARQAAESLNEELEAKVAARTGELQSALATLQAEVAEREKAEAQVRQMQKIESIGQLTGGIAHDFNNMLAVVLGSLEIVRRRIRSDPDRALTAVENAEEGAKRAALLTARLLAFSRRQPLAPEAVNVNKLVSGMSDLLRSTIGETVEVETVLSGGLWKTFIDAPQLENAILNLCVNARDAMPDGGRLTIETHNFHLDDSYAAQNIEVEAGQYVLVSVTDTGTGMSPEVIERAFDPFYTTKEVGKGTGLGLSQVHGFVKQSGGHIKIYSEKDQGTTIKLYFPRHFGAAGAKASGMAANAKALPTAKDGEVILVVEDEARVRQVSTEQLRDLGYKVIEASNGADALELLATTGRIDLIFTDIVMPGMTGRVLADEAAKQRADVKVLYTTGYTRNAVVHNGVLDPGTQFLAKPYTGPALAAKVRRVLDG